MGVAIMGIAGFIGLKNNLKTDIEFAGGFLKVGSFLFALLMICYAYMLSIGVWLLRKEKQIGKKFRIKGIKC